MGVKSTRTRPYGGKIKSVQGSGQAYGGKITPDKHMGAKSNPDKLGGKINPDKSMGAKSNPDKTIWGQNQIRTSMGTKSTRIRPYGGKINPDKVADKEADKEADRGQNIVRKPRF